MHIDLGTILVSATNKKTFHICNLNCKPISIKLNTFDQPSFEGTSQNRQILPG